ncbi:MAG: hypothetical protein P4L48_16340 [Mycobacterium sp.]|nr:hypothetical protein [Mycobacterium sp.]HKI39412.1 hypothetical protein [Mycobacterium sp.]
MRVGMETFTLDPRRWRVARLVGRNPLLRRTDRVEALVVLVALLASLLTIPLTGVLGVAVYGARERLYVLESHERHRVTATVTDTLLDGSDVTVVRAKWPGPVGERTGTFELASSARAGQAFEIWVGKDGKAGFPPTPKWHAVFDAVMMAGVALVIAGFALLSLVAVVHLRLNRARDSAWEREIRSLVEDGGRTNRQ